MAIESTKQLYDYVFRRLEVYDERERRQITEIVLEYFCDVDRTSILIDSAIEPVSDEMKQEFRNVTKRINTLEPVQYVLGETKFYGFDFFVNPSVLIPRPETEELVDLIQKQFKISDTPKIVDIGTGSGCIAITLAHLLPNAEISAIDVSAEAIEIAKDNVEENEVEIKLYCGDILTNDLPEKDYDVIVSNPPYITENEKALMSSNVLEHEPHLALFVPNENPLLFYNRISDLGQVSLKKGGKLFFEINEQFAQETKTMMESKGYTNVEIVKDLQDKDRIVVGEK
jgi:release factor glutamine methyltransferase